MAASATGRRKATVGKELAPISGAARNDGYFRLCVERFRANGLEIKGLPDGYPAE